MAGGLWGGPAASTVRADLRRKGSGYFDSMSLPASLVADRLVDGLRSGSAVTLSGSIPDEPVEHDETSAIDVDADLVRDLLRGMTVEDRDPRGLWLRGARIRGRLDLDHVDAVCPLVLEAC